ncbi:MAG: winged helix-turn-helix domain-containing protein [Oscillospiraceae bacterium]
MEKGKTIKQIADELGVSKQAISYRLKQLEKENDRQKNRQILAVKENGVLVVSLVGETLIKSAFSENDRQKENADLPPNNRQKDEDILAVLKATIDTLQKQLEIKDKQIEELISTNKAQAQSINADRHTELADRMLEAQEPKLLEEQKPKKRWQFWK